MRRIEKGFTLIELVIVLVILGILAAVAVPKFEDLAADAKTAAKSGAVSSVGSALAIKTAKDKATITGATVAIALPGSSCATFSTKAAIKVGSTGSIVYVTLQDGATALTDCASPATAIGAGEWTSA